MLKKCVCVLVVFTMLISFFSVSASAFVFGSPEEELIEYYLTWFVDTSIDIADGQYTANGLMDWYNTPEGYVYLTSLISLGGGGSLNFINNPGMEAARYVQDATGAKYMAANCKRDLVNQLYDTLNDYWSNDSAPVRNTSFRDAGFAVNCLGLRGNFGNIGGSGPAAKYTQDPAVSVTTFCTTEKENNIAYLYNGSLYFPPVLYVPYNGAVFRYGQALRQGYYIVTDDYNALFVPDFAYIYPFYFYYKDNVNTGGVNFYVNYNYNQNYNCGPDYWYYATDTKLHPDYHWATNNNDFPGEFILDKFTKAVGYHITNEHLELPWAAPDSDIPYDDNDYVVILLPIDQPSSPIYLSPTNYYNYIDDGSYYYLDNSEYNNVVNDYDVTYIYNYYNDYGNDDPTSSTDTSTDTNTPGGGFDISNIILRLDHIVNQLDVIINILNQPLYDEFSDVYINVPIINEVDQLLTDFKTCVSDSDPDPPEITISLMGFENDVNFSWYDSISGDIKSILSAFAYVSGVICCWLSLKSFFGINRGDDG